jgi:hypothetical protein
MRRRRLTKSPTPCALDDTDAVSNKLLMLTLQIKLIKRPKSTRKLS